MSAVCSPSLHPTKLGLGCPSPCTAPRHPSLTPVTPYLTRLPDGTIKQVNPFTGTQVWTLPGRAARPLGLPDHTPLPLDVGDLDRVCAFCPDRQLETTPEIARLIRVDGDWQERRDVLGDELTDTTAEFRLIPNLFEILSYDYWHLTHGHVPTHASEALRTAYLATATGRSQVEAPARIRMGARGDAGATAQPLAEADLQREAIGLFAGNHQVIVARRHFVDGAADDSQLASSGSLTPDEHSAYTGLAIRAMRDLYSDNPAARYVSVFQNWLRPAGSSFDHLHKQVVAIDEFGAQLTREAARLREEPDLYARWGTDYAAEQGLVVARTRTAAAFVGVGHRYPSLEVHSLVPDRSPWELTAEEVRDFSDLVHACHAATGALVPVNEEWHHRPPSLDLPMPLRAVIKWRVSTHAGFEGGTKIYVNTMDPWTVRAKVSVRLKELEATGHLSPQVTLC